MKRKFKINAKAQIAYIPDDLIAEGWGGDIDGFADALTITLVKPGASLDQIKRSLQLVLRDIGIRIIEEDKKLREQDVSG